MTTPAGSKPIRDISEILPVARRGKSGVSAIIPRLVDGVHSGATSFNNISRQSRPPLGIAVAYIVALSALGTKYISPQVGMIIGLLVAVKFLLDFIASKLVEKTTGVVAHITRPPEATSPETKLQKPLFKKSLEEGERPQEFIDPITYEDIEDPMGFPKDKSRTIYDRKTFEYLKENDFLTDGKFFKNPFNPKQTLDITEAVSLPKIKRQIDKFNQAHGSSED